MPKLWNDTIESHRREVRDAILDTTFALVAERGVRGVTMSLIAQQTGIGRATLYKYFPDVDSILMAWHERTVSGHLVHLQHIQHHPGDTAKKLSTVLESYSLMFLEHRGADFGALVHSGAHIDQAKHHLRDMISAIIKDGAASGIFRSDVTPDELAAFCLHAAGTSASLPSKAAVRRLIGVVMDGLRPKPGT